MKVAIIDKAPSRVDYKKWFDFDFDLFHMSSVPIQKLLKKDIDLVFDPEPYGLVILVGSEACKVYGGITSVTTQAGLLFNEKYVGITNPSVLVFKPEGQQDFDRSVGRIKRLVKGEELIAKGDYKGISSREEAKEFLLEVLNSKAEFVAQDTEGTGLYPRKGYVLGISMSYKPYHGRYILTDVLDDELLGIIQEINDTYPIIFHNMKYDIKMIEYHLGLTYNRLTTQDTMCMHYVLDENTGHGLKDLAMRYTDYGDYDAELDSWKKEYCRRTGIKEEDFTYDLFPFEIISNYASIDTAATWSLAHKFWPIIKANPKLNYVYNELLVRGTRFLLDIEEVGIPIDKERLTAAGIYLDKSIEEATAKLYEFEEIKLLEKDQGAIFNSNSVQQLRKLLFDYVGLEPTGKLTGTGAISTDAEVLEELAEQHSIPKALLELRKLGKIRSSYVTKILPALDRDSRIRTNFNLVFTTSGRLSSSGTFNAQQIPRDDPIIKGCIKAPKGFKIVSQDLQTGEMYVAAVLSKDKNLMSVFQSGGDFHSSIAKMVFGLDCPVEDVKKLYPALRQSAKAISFGILYGSGPAKVAETVHKATGTYYSISQAEDDIDQYFTKFSKLKSWLNSQKTLIKEQGFVYSPLGRKRRLLNYKSSDKGIVAGEVRSGVNALIQSLCSDINLLAAMDAHDELHRLGSKAKIFALVHDSIVSLVPEEEVADYCKILRHHTQKDRGFSIPGSPIGIDQEVGDDYSFGKFESYYKLENGILVKNADSR